MPDSLFPQSLSKFSLDYLLAYPLHFILFAFFTQSLSSLCSTCPYNHNLVCCSTKIMSSNLSLSLSPLLGTLSCSFMPHIYPSNHSHLCSLKCHLIFLSYGPDLISMQHITLHTTAVQSPSHYQRHILIGKQWYQLREFIPSNSNSGLHSCIIICTYTQHVT